MVSMTDNIDVFNFPVHSRHDTKLAGSVISVVQPPPPPPPTLDSSLSLSTIYRIFYRLFIRNASRNVSSSINHYSKKSLLTRIGRLSRKYASWHSHHENNNCSCAVRWKIVQNNLSTNDFITVDFRIVLKAFQNNNTVHNIFL